MQTATSTATFNQHKSAVRCVQFDSSKIVSASDDALVKYDFLFFLYFFFFSLFTYTAKGYGN